MSAVFDDATVLHGLWNRGVGRFAVGIVALSLLGGGARASAGESDRPASAESAGENERSENAEATEERARATAVALNYCKAAFHRIRRYPSKQVLLEEREKILNNLNLNRIADEEVVKLYSAALEEISEVHIAERERQVLHRRYRHSLGRTLAATAFATGTNFALGQYVSAIRSGASSWWDYRMLGWNRDLDIWRVERDRMVAVVDKSTRFLDTFWKLARRARIPDRWLVRDDDLDRLEAATRESDPETRLRVLKRMERFMECYPPYWYYVARTQQTLGQLFAAGRTFAKVAELGEGHFRKDELLAASLANRAIIQDYLHQPSAPQTARRALLHSNEVWEANLLCAQVLLRHGERAQAEDAILRNLDVDLERPESLTALAALYMQTQQREKLVERLGHEDDVRVLPVPVLLQSIAFLGTSDAPAPALEQIASSFEVQARLRFGDDDLVLRATPNWHLAEAEVTVEPVGVQQPSRLPSTGGETPPARTVAQTGRGQPKPKTVWDHPRLSTDDGRTEARFHRVDDWGGPLARTAEVPPLVVTLVFPGSSPIRLHVQPDTAGGPGFQAATAKTAGSALPPHLDHPRRRMFSLVAVDVAESRISLRPKSGGQSAPGKDAEPARESPPSPTPDSRLTAPTRTGALPMSRPTAGDEAMPPAERTSDGIPAAPPPPESP